MSARRSGLSASALVVVTLAACGGSLARRGSIETTIGRATYHDILTEVPALLRGYRYAIYATRETGSTVTIETDWRNRAPFEDEAELGADLARSRFIVRARRAGAALYTVRITAENQVHLPLPPASVEAAPVVGGDGWTTMPATAMYRTYVDEIVTEVELKVDAGLRTHGQPIR